MMEETYRLVASAKVGGRYYERGNIVSEAIANLGYPSLKSLGLVVPVAKADESRASKVSFPGDTQAFKRRRKG